MTRPGQVLFRLVLWILFLASCYLVWDRRLAWAVVDVLPGRMPDACTPYTPVPFVHDFKGGRIYFADTKEWHDLPGGGQDMFITYFCPTRRIFHFIRSSNNPVEFLWDMGAGREIEIPEFARESWKTSEDGTRLLLRDLKKGAPRRFQTRSLDGRVLHELSLPPGQGPDPRFSAGGEFVLEPGDGAFQVHDMSTGKRWSFADFLIGLSDAGLIWLLKDDTLRAFDLRERRKLWTAEGVAEAFQPAPDLILVRLKTGSVRVLGARRGEHRVDLENAEAITGSLSGFWRLDDGPRRHLVAGDWFWRIDTGRRFPLDTLPYLGLEFFADGRRALLGQERDYPVLIDLESGRALFRFASSRPFEHGIGLGYARLAGDRVMTRDPDHWDRVWIWGRRHPEGIWGHLHRPEVWGAVLLGTLLLVGSLTRR